jgi:hypothetical protein
LPALAFRVASCERCGVSQSTAGGVATTKTA